MKSVVTLWQKPETFVFLKLAQANGTIGAFNQAFIFSVFADGDGGNDCLLETGGADVPDGMVNDRTMFFLVQEILFCLWL